LNIQLKDCTFQKHHAIEYSVMLSILTALVIDRITRRSNITIITYFRDFSYCLVMMLHVFYDCMLSRFYMRDINLERYC